MLVDTDAIRVLAAHLRERAEEIRDEARALTAHAERTSWRGLAADAMRARVEQRAAGLGRTADRHEDAAEAIVQHAERVDRVRDLLADLLDRGQDLARIPLRSLDPRRIAELLS